jgi:hypothetical protein
MWLNRTTPDPLEDYRDSSGIGERSEDFRADTSHFEGEPTFKVVTVTFPRFGNGKKRRSDFEVTVHWEDVEKILEKFCEAGQPEALAIRSAIQLAAAAKELGWRHVVRRRSPERDTPNSN